MPKVKMTGKQVREAIKRDDRYRLARERKTFMAWWMTYDDREAGSLKVAWNAWKRRAGL